MEVRGQGKARSQCLPSLQKAQEGLAGGSESELLAPAERMSTLVHTYNPALQGNGREMGRSRGCETASLAGSARGPTSKQELDHDRGRHFGVQLWPPRVPTQENNQRPAHTVEWVEKGQGGSEKEEAGSGMASRINSQAKQTSEDL